MATYENLAIARGIANLAGKVTKKLTENEDLGLSDATTPEEREEQISMIVLQKMNHLAKDA